MKVGQYQILDDDGRVVYHFSSWAEIARHYCMSINKLQKILGKEKVITARRDMEIVSSVWSESA